MYPYEAVTADRTAGLHSREKRIKDDGPAVSHRMRDLLARLTALTQSLLHV
jgi:hypothetical protein